MLRAIMRRNGLDTIFESVLSTDRIRAFKPAPEAYSLAISALGVRKQEIGFAAFAAWDSAGAS
jgi:2-haloacid dehalogenase